MVNVKWIGLRSCAFLQSSLHQVRVGFNEDLKKKKFSARFLSRNTSLVSFLIPFCFLPGMSTKYTTGKK